MSRLLTVLAAMTTWVASPLADSCSPPQPIRVSAVCGRTLLLVGGRFDVPEGRPYAHATVVPRRPVQLWRDGLKVAETVSDDNGRFAFSRTDQGAYRLVVPYSVYTGIASPIVVTEHRAVRCATPVFLYVGPEEFPCRAHASTVRPLRLSTDTIQGKK